MDVSVRVMFEDWADQSVALPAYQTAGSAGADLRANFPAEDRAAGLQIPPMGRVVVPTGIRVAIPQGYELQVRPRSGLAVKFGVTVPNSPGTIDSDYRGPLGVALINLGDQPFVVAHGDRVAQVVIAPVARGIYAVVEELDATLRGTGGFGSTGRR